MKAKMGFGLVALAGLAACAVANDNVPVPHRTLVPAHTKITGNVYINYATGDRITVPGVARDGTGVTQYNNNDWFCNGGGTNSFFYTPMVSNGIYDLVNGFDSEVFSYGDAPAGTEFNCYVWLYVAEDIADDGVSAVGFDSLATFYDNDNSDPTAGPDGDVTPSSAFLVSNIRGDTTTNAGDGGDGWILTIDVSGVSGTDSYLVGDLDEDGDGLADIGWGYTWGGAAIAPGNALATAEFGPGAALPGNVGGLPELGSGDALPRAQGCWNDLVATAAGWFSVDALGNNDGIITADELRGGLNPSTLLYDNILFNGSYGPWSVYPCDGTPDLNTITPYISLYIDFLNPASSNCPACTADYNNDTAVNSSDFLEYLNDYSAQDPCADLAPAGGDSAWNSSDFLAFLNAYSAGC
ncbi:MAG: GC-type dockerin domain-anchored protein [Phycisphaerales bacterium]|nr:GC-type dockerin domain-anchored protein [Phycisphaerales bacterium]